METFGFQWHITDRCPGGCLHCYQERFDGGAEARLDELKGIASHIISALDVPVSINLTGGEPLLYRGIFELMTFLAAFPNLDELNIITSSFKMDPGTVKKLKALPKLTAVKISLESRDSFTNDYIRGRGHFKMAVDNIGSLVREGIPVIIMVTVSGCNYRCIEGICSLAAEIGAKGVIFERYVPLGRGAGFSNSVLNPEQWSEVMRAVCRAADLDEESADDLRAYKAFWVDMPYGMTGERCSIKGALCNLGSSSMALMPDGTVFPCRRLPVPAGKLPSDSMEQVLSVLDKYSPEGLRPYMRDGGCGSCQVDGCAGCRALALALGKGLYGDDPLCQKTMRK
ncbi:MAG: radical SAM protein [Chitinispirillales bacterium]|jgi:radical SAM protein with 4Fe4S-binding SPASM domain|nr:radical SAM protein [Chitinispirillales bacterium]